MKESKKGDVLSITNDMPSMPDRDLVGFIEHVKVQTGLSFDESKRYLFESRLGPLLKEFNLSCYGELLQSVSRNDECRENQALISAITTNETYFFRDEHPFELLKYKLIPDLLGKQRNANVMIGSAACSTGQEAYSMAMVLKEILFDLTKFRVQIKGFDISDDVIVTASTGHYSTFEVQRGLSSDKIRRYFDVTNGRYHINPELRSIVTFCRYNLLKPENLMGKFDIIFCRNVVNYFGKKERMLLFNNLAELLVTGGTLVIGATELLSNDTNRFEKHRAFESVYYKKVS